MLQKGLLFIGSLRFPAYSLGPGVLRAHGRGAALPQLLPGIEGPPRSVFIPLKGN